MSGAVLVVLEHDRGTIAPAALEALTAGRALAAQLGTTLEALTIGGNGDSLVADAESFGADVVHQAHHELLTDYNPEAWGEVVAQMITATQPAVVVASGTDRGNEVLAQAAARSDSAFVANCLTFEPGQPGDTFGVTRVRWGGSLIERATVAGAGTKLLTIAQP